MITMNARDVSSLLEPAPITRTTTNIQIQSSPSNSNSTSNSKFNQSSTPTSTSRLNDDDENSRMQNEIEKENKTRFFEFRTPNGSFSADFNQTRSPFSTSKSNIPNFHSDHDLHATTKLRLSTSKGSISFDKNVPILPPSPPIFKSHQRSRSKYDDEVPPDSCQQIKYSPFNVFADCKQGAKQYQEDSCFTFTSISELILVCGVFDGHGSLNGLRASQTARNYCLRKLQHYRSTCEFWTIDEWKHQLSCLFDEMQNEIRQCFMLNETSSACTNSSHSVKRTCSLDQNLMQNKDQFDECCARLSTSLNSSCKNLPNRYIDEIGVVRSLDGTPIHGGSTCSITVTIRPSKFTSLNSVTVVTANVGDSTALLINTRLRQFDFLTVDHGPENEMEYQRIQSLPKEQHPVKLLFVYDKTSVQRKFECPLVWNPQTNRKNDAYLRNPWGLGLHPTNVRYEAAVYAVSPACVTKDSTCIAMTRSIGDFYAQQFGLTHVPDISVRQIDLDAVSDYCIVLGSDGVWDCWKYECLTELISELCHQKFPISLIGQSCLDESIKRAIASFGAKHFDDATLCFWKLEIGKIN